MDIARLLNRDGGGRASRQEVTEAVERRLAERPERSHDEILAGLRGDATRSESAARVDDPPSASGDSPAAESPASPDLAANVPLPIVATITAQQTVRSGLPITKPGTLGRMDPTFSFTGVSHEEKEGQVHLTATLHCDYHWGVDPTGGGRTDVPSADAPFITADNAEEIADAIDPDLGDHPNTATLDGYWSKAAVEAHEQEHARDDWADWGAQNTGVQVAKAAWEAETVPADDIDGRIADLQSAGGDAWRHPGKIPEAVMAASDVHYGASLDYPVRPGEIKAFAAGAEVERPLAAAVRARGDQLAEEAAAAAEAAAAIYTVVRGDTLYRISERLLGASSRWREIYALNRDVIGPNPDLIHPGQQLCIPTVAAAPAPGPEAAAAPVAAVDSRERDVSRTVDAIMRTLK